MSFQSPQPVQLSCSDGPESKIPVRRLSEAPTTPRQAEDSPSAVARARFGSLTAQKELSDRKRGVQSEAEFCPRAALPRTPARGLASLMSPELPASAGLTTSPELRFESQEDWLSHHDEGLQLTADYSGGSLPPPTTPPAEEPERSSSPSSVDSDAPSSPGEESPEPPAEEPAAAAAPAEGSWQAKAAAAGLELADLEGFGKMTAKSLIQVIGKLPSKGAAAVGAYEHEHSDRKTVMQAAEKRRLTAAAEE